MRLFYLVLTLWMMCAVGHPAFAAKHKKNHIYRTNKNNRTHTVIRPTATITRLSPPARMRYNGAQLANELSQIISTSGGDTDMGVYVKSMKYGDSLFARNITQSLTPASTMKIMTAEAALLFLGQDYRFSTQLLTDAKSVKNGILQGNLYVVLSGDPTLTITDLGELLAGLKSQQIYGVNGNVYIDNTAYDQSFYGPGWIGKDRGYCYAAPISASIINHNCLSFQVPPAAGRLKQVSTKSFNPGLRSSMLSKSRTGACAIHLSTDPGSVLSIDGCLPKGGFSAGVASVVTDVPEYNRALFKSLLAQLGVSVYGTVTFGSASENLSMISTHSSEPLKDLVRSMLKKSDNVIAGALFKKMGQLYTRSPGSWANGSLAVSQILAKRAGMTTSGLRILDGSGLSPDNLTTPAQMMQVLSYAFHDATSEAFISALPIAGVDGTLKHRMYNIARKVRAKTGTISGVIGLVGYALSSDNEPVAFVIMINGRKGFGWRYKSIEDKIATVITRYSRDA